MRGTNGAYPPRRLALDTSLPCQPWSGSTADTGYGQVMIDGQVKSVHRLAYQLFVGPIPRRWQVDHACHNKALAEGRCEPGPCEHRRCFEPAHLEAVSSRMNSERGGHLLFTISRSDRCGRGHDLTDPQHVYRRPDGRRRCRTCSRMTTEERRACDSKR